jgi:Fic family protein
MRRTYLWERADWPAFTFTLTDLFGPLLAAVETYGRLAGVIEGASARDRHESEVRALVADAIDTSAIEGEHLDHDAVRASIVRRLSLAGTGVRRSDDRSEGVVEVTLDALRYNEPVTQERLFAWHSELFPIVRNHRPLSRIGEYRDDAEGPMAVQTTRGAGREPIIHYEAPPAARVPDDMRQLIEYIETPSSEDGMVRAAVVHLWFLLIHPFEDGNGRIARALADLMLSRARGPANRYCSLSRQILIEQKDYYDQIERAGYATLDSTAWVAWFIQCYTRAATASIAIVQDVIRATSFFTEHSETDFNERQRKIVKRLLDGFDGNLNAARYASMTSVSHDTANRDLADLVEKGILERAPGGSKNTHYIIPAKG